MGKSMEVPQKFIKELPYYLVTPFLDIYLTSENKILKRYMHSHVYDSIIHSNQDVEIA